MTQNNQPTSAEQMLQNHADPKVREAFQQLKKEQPKQEPTIIRNAFTTQVPRPKP